MCLDVSTEEDGARGTEVSSQKAEMSLVEILKSSKELDFNEINHTH